MVQLSQARLGAMSLPEVVAGFDVAHGLLVEAQAVLLRYARQVDVLRAASKDSACSAAVWYRGRHRIGIRSAHRLVRIAKRVEAAPEVVGEAVACGAVNLDQAEVVTRALARIPPRSVSMCGSGPRTRW